MRQQTLEDVEDVGNILLNLFLRCHCQKPDGHERVVPVPLLPPLQAPVYIDHRLLQVVGHELVPAGGGQPGQQIDNHVLDVGVFTECGVLTDSQHQLTQLTVPLLQDGLTQGAAMNWLPA